MKYTGQERAVCTRCGEEREISSFYIATDRNKNEEYKVIKMPCKVCAYRARMKRLEVVSSIIDSARVKKSKPRIVTCAEDCELYPCFSGIETLRSNLALTCNKFKRK